MNLYLYLRKVEGLSIDWWLVLMEGIVIVRCMMTAIQGLSNELSFNLSKHFVKFLCTAVNSQDWIPQILKEVWLGQAFVYLFTIVKLLHLKIPYFGHIMTTFLPNFHSPLNEHQMNLKKATFWPYEESRHFIYALCLFLFVTITRL